MVNYKAHNIPEPIGTIIHIKNMVCPRCIEAVKSIFKELNFHIKDIQLGKVSLSKPLNITEQNNLEHLLQRKGFELLQDSNVKLVHQIKSTIIEYIHYGKDNTSDKISDILINSLGHNYTHLSKVFSAVEGKTIERFTLMQRIERVKEFLFHNELTLSEIAFQLGYSSTAHLSSQFKKEVGMTPSEYKKMEKSDRKFLDKI